MSELLNPMERSQTSSVEKFLTEMWFHTLLDQRTLDHRNTKIRALHDILTEEHITLDNKVGLLVGSSLWTVNESSDADFVFFTTSTSHEMINNNSLANKLHDKDNIQIANEIIIQWLFTEGVNLLPILFFTPDEYTIGNKNLLHELRMKGIQYIEDYLQPNKYWDALNSDVKQYFQCNYEEWGKSHMFQGVEYNRRKPRLERKISERSKQSHNPVVWEYKFRKSIETFHTKIPSFTAYKQTLIRQDGALTLSPDFISQGIQISS